MWLWNLSLTFLFISVRQQIQVLLINVRMSGDNSTLSAIVIMHGLSGSLCGLLCASRWVNKCSGTCTCTCTCGGGGTFADACKFTISNSSVYASSDSVYVKIMSLLCSEEVVLTKTPFGDIFQCLAPLSWPFW